MKRVLSVFAVLSALAFTGQAQAQERMDPNLVATGIVTGAAATATFFALTDWTWSGSWSGPARGGLTVGGAYAVTSVGCAVVAPMIGTVVVKRQLTAREANLLVVGCFVPVVGPLVLNAIYDANPQWFPQPVKVRKVAAKKKR